MAESGGATPAVRASDGERDAAVTRLREAAADRRLTLDEFADRVDRALAAITRADLEALTADLPGHPPDAGPAGGGRRWVVSVMGGASHRGRWRIASRCTVVNVMGGADLDLSDALVPGAKTEVRVLSLMGGSTIAVPAGVHVELSGLAIMGGNDLRLGGAPPRPGAPVVRVRAYSLMGDTVVKVKRGGAARRPPAPPLAPGER